MPHIIVKEDDDNALERICPQYLRGPGGTTRRVAWAIERALLADIDKKAEEARKAAEQHGDTP